MVDHNNKQQSPLCNRFEMILEKKEVIPFFLVTASGNLFNAVIVNDRFGTVYSPVFIMEELNTERGCLVLTILIPIDIEGCPIDLGSDLYSFLLTNHRITLNLDGVCGIVPLPPGLINRYLPIPEPKC